MYAGHSETTRFVNNALLGKASIRREDAEHAVALRQRLALAAFTHHAAHLQSRRKWRLGPLLVFSLAREYVYSKLSK